MEKACDVCIETITKQPHKKEAKCPYCPIKVCVKCTQTYLLGTYEDPHCMGCRRGWSREVMDDILLKTWLNGDYKIHRQNILLDRERSRLPAAQLILERHKIASERSKTILEPLGKEIYEMQLQLNLKQNEYMRELRRIEAYKRGEDPNADDTAKEIVKEEKRVFIMPCPVTGCRGFLSQAYKCGVCDTYTCSDCREIKGMERDGDHTCDPNTVATVRAMKKECRGCPECGTNIFKIEGCNQMFCTNCNTPFDWVSGKKIVNGAIHNPHYFEYLRASNNGVMPRNPGDIPCIANLPGAWQFDREVTRKFHGAGLHSDLTGFLYNALNTITHIRHEEIRRNTNNAEDIDNTTANLKYLSQEYTEVRWKQVLQQKEKRRMKRDEIRMRCEAFVGACVDIYGRIMNEARQLNSTIDWKKNGLHMTEICKDSVLQMHALSKIFNEGMMGLSKRYNCQVIQINQEFKIQSKKYISSKNDDTSTVCSNEPSEDTTVSNDVHTVINDAITTIATGGRNVLIPLDR